MLSRFVSIGFRSIFCLVILCAGVSYSQTTKSGLPNSSELCQRLAQIKEFPHSNDTTDLDPAYEALYRAGEVVVPCLIDKISDVTVVTDPRCPRIFQETKVGDLAYFLLVRITNIKFDEMLPVSIQKKYRVEGVYAYHDFIERKGARQRLQSKLRDWYRQRLQSHMSKRARELKTQGDELIARIESFKRRNDRLPRTISELGLEEKLEGPIYYQQQDSSSYIIWFGMELGESITYDSTTKKWSK